MQSFQNRYTKLSESDLLIEVILDVVVSVATVAMAAMVRCGVNHSGAAAANIDVSFFGA